MGKTLKIWNGGRIYSGKHKGVSVYVAAYSMKQAAEIINTAIGNEQMTASEISTYYNKGSWGNDMAHITPTEPCVYVTESYKRNPTPVKLYPQS